MGSVRRPYVAHSWFKEKGMGGGMQTLSVSGIPYRVTMHSPGGEGGLQCVDIAEALHVTNPSVHRMMETLGNRALIQKVKYGTVSLTEEGHELAARYAMYYDIIFRFFCRKLALSPEDSKNAAFALLAGISAESMETICEIMRNTA